jgi:hypothetical protein
MKQSMRIAAAIVILAMGPCVGTGQMASPAAYEGGDDNPRANVNVGGPLVLPLNPTARAVNLGFGVIVGSGYNFSRRHGLVGEFLWNNLFPTNEALAKIRTALNNPKLNASVHVTSLTGNYRFELRGKNLGTYFIGGGGLYYRKTSLSQTVTTGNSISCTPTWLWWGFTCTSSTVDANQTVGSWASTAGGVNGGIGFTARVGEAPYRMYVESRYHYAPNKRVDLQMIELTVGIRY